MVKMDASWFMEFVDFVRESWQWCTAAIVMLLCLHHLIGNSGSEHGAKNAPNSRFYSTANNYATTISPITNVPYYSVSDQEFRSKLNPSDRLCFDNVVSNCQQLIDYCSHYGCGRGCSAKELKAKASALQKSMEINCPSSL